MDGENLTKSYLAQTKRLSMNRVSHREKTRGVKMKDSLAMLLKTNIEKMSVYGPLAMLMKNKLVKIALSRC